MACYFSPAVYRLVHMPSSFAESFADANQRRQHQHASLMLLRLLRLLRPTEDHYMHHMRRGQHTRAGTQRNRAANSTTAFPAMNQIARHPSQ